jgi:hypothetical protein
MNGHMSRKQVSNETSKNFSEHLFKSFWASYGHIMAFVGIAVGLIAIYVVPDKAVLSLRYAAIPILIGVYLILWFLYTAWSAFHIKTIVVPGVVSAKPPPKAFSSSKALLLVEPSVIYSHDSVVSIYFLEDEFERLIGVGRVYNVQDNKIIQVLVTHDLDFGDEWNSIVNNDATKLTKLRIKPTVPSSAMENHFNE